MTVARLIERLSEYPPDTEVLIYDPNSEGVETITGFLYSNHDNTLELCSDDTE